MIFDGVPFWLRMTSYIVEPVSYDVYTSILRFEEACDLLTDEELLRCIAVLNDCLGPLPKLCILSRIPKNRLMVRAVRIEGVRVQKVNTHD